MLFDIGGPRPFYDGMCCNTFRFTEDITPHLRWPETVDGVARTAWTDEQKRQVLTLLKHTT